MEPVLQHIASAIIPVEVVTKKHKLAACQLVTSGDVIGERLTDGVVCSQSLGNRTNGCAPLAEECRKKVCILESKSLFKLVL
jgi:hypothetical protein